MRRALPLLLLAACQKQPEPANAVAAADVAAEASKLKLQPGEWETTTTLTALDVPGLPADAAKAATGTPTTTRNCVTPEQAAKPGADFLSGTADGNCTYQRFSMANGGIDAAMTCRPAAAPGAVAVRLHGGYAPSAFAMGMEMKTDLPGGAAMTMRARVAGRRIGPCATNTETKI